MLIDWGVTKDDLSLIGLLTTLFVHEGIRSRFAL